MRFMNNNITNNKHINSNVQLKNSKRKSTNMSNNSKISRQDSISTGNSSCTDSEKSNDTLKIDHKSDSIIETFTDMSKCHLVENKDTKSNFPQGGSRGVETGQMSHIEPQENLSSQVTFSLQEQLNCLDRTEEISEPLTIYQNGMEVSKCTLKIYEDVIKNSNTRYIVKNINDSETDMTISNENIRIELLKKYPELIDLVLMDTVFESVLHDLYINFFYSTYTTHRSENDKKILKSKYKEISISEDFRSFLFTILNIKDSIDLQERYLDMVFSKMARKFSITQTYSEKALLSYNKKEILINEIAKNYLNILKTGKYKKVAKYINGDSTNIYISNPEVRNKLSTFVDEYKLENPNFDIKFIFEFEEKTIPVIARILIDNFIRNRVSTINRKKCKYQCEKIIYNNHECTKMIQYALGENSSLCYDYMNIIINCVVTQIINTPI